MLPGLIASVVVAWALIPAEPPDFDGDGNVGFLDLLSLFADWGKCP